MSYHAKFFFSFVTLVKTIFGIMKWIMLNSHAWKLNIYLCNKAQMQWNIFPKLWVKLIRHALKLNAYLYNKTCDVHWNWSKFFDFIYVESYVCIVHMHTRTSALLQQIIAKVDGIWQNITKFEDKNICHKHFWIADNWIIWSFDHSNLLLSITKNLS